MSNALFQDAMRVLESSEITYRAIRTEFVGCSSDSEYLAKLHCLRQAFDHIMQQEHHRKW